MKGSVAITGGSKGIGLALAKQFAKNEFRVAICGRNEVDLNQAKQQLNDLNSLDHVAISCDISTKEGTIAFQEGVLNTIGTPQILINNAGVFIPGKIQDEDENDFFIQLNTNLVSTYRVTKSFLSQMIMRRSGTIINICSTASITPYINGGSYCISKFGQYGLTKVLREELKEHNIRVTAVLPGATLTNSWSGTTLPEERFLSPDDVAETVFHHCQLPENCVVEDLVIRPILGDIV